MSYICRQTDRFYRTPLIELSIIPQNTVRFNSTRLQYILFWRLFYLPSKTKLIQFPCKAINCGETWSPRWIRLFEKERDANWILQRIVCLTSRLWAGGNWSMMNNESFYTRLNCRNVSRTRLHQACPWWDGAIFISYHHCPLKIIAIQDSISLGMGPHK